MTSPRDVVDALAQASDPTADVAALRACARRLEAIATQTEAVGRAFTTAHTRAGLGAGGLREGTDHAAHAIAGARGSAVADVVARLGALAATLDGYADEVVGTRDRLSLASAIAERDLLRAEIASLVGHPTALVAASGAATSVFGTIGDAAVERAAQLDPGHTDRASSDPQPDDQSAGSHSPTSGAYPPMASGAAFPGMVAAAPVAAAAMAGAFGGHPDPPPEVDGTRLAERARELHASLPRDLTQWVRMSVGVGCTAARELIEVVGTSDPVAYLRTGVTIGATEHLAGSPRGSEFAIAEHFEAIGARPLAVASAHPVPAHVTAHFGDLGVRLIAPSAAVPQPVGEDPDELDD